jgi:hypothetical protein
MRWGAIILIAATFFLADAMAFDGRYRARLEAGAWRIADAVGAEIGAFVRQITR